MPAQHPLFAYPEFRYGADPRRRSVNLGDNIQSMAVRRLLEHLGIPPANIIGVDRDGTRDYEGPPAKLVMNGCFHEGCFPLSSRIEPIFFGFNAESEAVVTRNLALFRAHQPIGCRDAATCGLLRKHGIAAYVTGCATATFPRRSAMPARAQPVIAFGAGPGELPGRLLSHMPKPLLEAARLIYQREPVATVPLPDAEVARLESLAARYLEAYQQASLVVTPLLHVAFPCLAMGVPVVLARRDHDDRFTAIDRLLPLYTPANLHAIDWTPLAPDLRVVKQAMFNTAASLLRGSAPAMADLRTLQACYEAAPVLTDPPHAEGFLGRFLMAHARRRASRGLV